MVRHFVSWNFKEHGTEKERAEVISAIRNKIQEVTNLCDGCISCEVYAPLLNTSTADVLLSGLFLSEKDLAEYQVHPVHQEAVAIIKENLTNRVCVDFEVSDER